MLQKMPNLQLFAIRDHGGKQISELVYHAIVFATSRGKKVCIKMYEHFCRDTYSSCKEYVEVNVLKIEGKQNQDGVAKCLASETFNIAWSELWLRSISKDLEEYLKENLKVGAYTFHSYKNDPFLLN